MYHDLEHKVRTGSVVWVSTLCVYALLVVVSSVVWGVGKGVTVWEISESLGSGFGNCSRCRVLACILG